MEKDVAAQQRRIAELQQVLYKCRQSYLQTKKQLDDAEEHLAANSVEKAHYAAILTQVVPKIQSGVKAIQSLHKDQLRALRVLRQLPSDAQRAVEVMYIMLKCDAFEELWQLQGVYFDENAYRMMLNMDEYLRKMETFDIQLLADRPHVLQYIVDTYFGGTPIHKNDTMFDDSPSTHWSGEVLQHEDLLGIGRKRKESTKMPPVRRAASVPTVPKNPTAGSRMNTGRSSAATGNASQPAVSSLLPKATRLPPIPAGPGRIVNQPSGRRDTRCSTAPAIAAPSKKHAGAISIQYVFTEGSELPDDFDEEPRMSTGPLNIKTVQRQNRAIGSLFHWCVSQLQYAEILRKEGPVLEYYANSTRQHLQLTTQAASCRTQLEELNEERQQLEADIQELVAKHHVRHLQLAHLLHDQALAPEDESRQRQAIEAEEAKGWTKLCELWDRYWREWRQKTKKLMADEEEKRVTIVSEQYAARRKVTEQIHHKLEFILEFMARRTPNDATVADRPAVPLPWY